MDRLLFARLTRPHVDGVQRVGLRTQHVELLAECGDGYDVSDGRRCDERRPLVRLCVVHLARGAPVEAGRVVDGCRVPAAHEHPPVGHDADVAMPRGGHVGAAPPGVAGVHVQVGGWHAVFGVVADAARHVQ